MEFDLYFPSAIFVVLIVINYSGGPLEQHKQDRQEVRVVTT